MAADRSSCSTMCTTRNCILFDVIFLSVAQFAVPFGFSLGRNAIYNCFWRIQCTATAMCEFSNSILPFLKSICRRDKNHLHSAPMHFHSSDFAWRFSLTLSPAFSSIHFVVGLCFFVAFFLHFSRHTFHLATRLVCTWIDFKCAQLIVVCWSGARRSGKRRRKRTTS